MYYNFMLVYFSPLEAHVLEAVCKVDFIAYYTSQFLVVHFCGNVILWYNYNYSVTTLFTTYKINVENQK